MAYYIQGRYEKEWKERHLYPFFDGHTENRICDINDKISPFYGYIGNEKAVKIAFILAKGAFRAKWVSGDWPVVCSTRQNRMRICLTGPASVGKTLFARNLIKMCGTDYITNEWRMPFAEIDGTSIKNREQIIERIKIAIYEKGHQLKVTRRMGISYSELPAMGLFIDEVHALPEKVKDGILKMSERNDGIFETETEKIDCRNISILIATTNPGKLPAALKSRFPIRIALEKHTENDLAKIIQGTYRDWKWDDCKRLAKLQSIPREAKEIASFVEQIKSSNGCTIDEAITIAAEQFNLMEDGVSARAMEVLYLLAEYPSGLSKKNICGACSSMDEEEFTQEILPQLLNKQLILVGHRHKITEKGLKLKEKMELVSM